ncbi:MAG: lipid-binding SYLF domain-containing protein [Epsilonproteobacteria bacterium]|nr:lipid-binding SYLF domain-containing protein [Campylobacterota bacterium]
MKKLKSAILSIFLISLLHSYYPNNSNCSAATPPATQPRTSPPVPQDLTITPKDILITIQKFYKEFKGGEELLRKAEGYLVFPTIYEAGLIVGGKYGFGALVQNNSIVSYYKIYSTSVGLSVGVKKYSLIIVFMTKDALRKFLNKEEWKLSLDTYITFTNWSKGVDINSLDLRKDTIVIPFNDVGIMADISFEGTVFQKLP